MDKILAEIQRMDGSNHTWVEKGKTLEAYQDEAVVAMDVIHDVHANDERRRRDSHFHRMSTS